MTKVSSLAVADLRRRAADGESTRSLATAFGIHFGTAWGIIKGKQRRSG